MQYNTFEEFLKARYSNKGSATRYSYLKAIEIIDTLFQQNDVFGLKNKSIKEIEDPFLMAKIIDFIVEEEAKFRKEESSIFDLGSSKQISYPQKRFCTGAIRQLGNYVKDLYFQKISAEVSERKMSAEKMSTFLSKEFDVNKEGRDKMAVVKRRIGQDFYRTFLLSIYSSKCCLTGLDVPEVLRASHIIPWAKQKSSRMNPTNGLILSATYDAAFDKHLISFDEDYRMIMSPVIRELYSSESFKKYFLDFEGKKIALPIKFWPSQKFLEIHRKETIENNYGLI